MGRYKNTFTILTLAVMVFGLTAVASAQWRNPRGNNGYYGTYNRNLENTVSNLSRKSRSFRDLLDRELDRSRYDGSRREDQLNDLAKRFQNAANDLDDEHDNYRDFNRSRDEAQRVISIGSQLDRVLINSRGNRNYTIRNAWNSIENDLRVLARAYNMRYANSRNNRVYQNRNRYPNRTRNRYPTNRRGTYYPGSGRYYGNLRGTIVNLRNKSARFEDLMDNERDNRYGRYSGNIESLSNRFNDAVKDLEDEYNDNSDYNDSYDEARNVLNIGQQIDYEISRSGVSSYARNQWSSIRRDLETLARAYNMPYNRRRGTYTSIGDIIRSIPF